MKPGLVHPPARETLLASFGGSRQTVGSARISGVQVGGRFAGRIGGLGQTVDVTLHSGEELRFRVWNGGRFADQVLEAKNAAGPG